jgi:hypothetical protein
LKRTLFCIISIFVFFAQLLLSQNTNTETNTVQDYSTAQLSIKFFDRTVYYAGDPEDNPIYVHITISNTGTQTLRFKLADDRMFSIDFNAFTVRNDTLSSTDVLIKKRTTSQTVYFREISLEPGEEYSFIENVKDYLLIPEPSVYYLELSFYPEMYKNKQISLKSNRLSLEIQPSPSAASSSFVPVKNKTAALLKPQEISPDKVVEQTIIARQKSLWDQYFLYIDIEELLQADEAQKRKYRSVSANERDRMRENFKADLMQDRIDNDIVAIPDKFEIERTAYSQTTGTVEVIEWFKHQTYSEKKRYTYFVRQRDGIWQIYNYSVDNLGTE